MLLRDSERVSQSVESSESISVASQRARDANREHEFFTVHERGREHFGNLERRWDVACEKTKRGREFGNDQRLDAVEVGRVERSGQRERNDHFERLFNRAELSLVS